MSNVEVVFAKGLTRDVRQGEFRSDSPREIDGPECGAGRLDNEDSGNVRTGIDVETKRNTQKRFLTPLIMPGCWMGTVCNSPCFWCCFVLNCATHYTTFMPKMQGFT